MISETEWDGRKRLGLWCFLLESRVLGLVRQRSRVKSEFKFWLHLECMWLHSSSHSDLKVNGQPLVGGKLMDMMRGF